MTLAESRVISSRLILCPFVPENSDWYHTGSLVASIVNGKMSALAKGGRLRLLV